MKYNLLHDLVTNSCKYEENKLSARSFFVPFDSLASAVVCDFNKSINNNPYIINLCGTWDFIYYGSHNSIPFIETDDIQFDTLDVPSVWQTKGIEPPYYVNSFYQFDCKPPLLPDDFPMGIYRKKIDITDLERQYILTFLGVAGGLAVYCNSEFVGYSEGSHNTAEFDITPYLSSGNNEIVAVVYKWCTGTYLEAQDMFRSNGIFREVYLQNLPLSNIYDYAVKTTKKGEFYDLGVSIRGLYINEGTINVALKSFDGNILAEGTVDKKILNISFKDLNVNEWSAETPNLYTLTIDYAINENEHFCIIKNIGFKTVRVAGETFLFNDRPIKLFGVNHHDTSPYGGYYQTQDELETDVKLMKELNVNAVRTSHYPPHPYFIELCNKYGLYVIDEADIETHGCNEIHRINLISNNTKWALFYIDRVMRLFERDKNDPSITMWSLGNESGGIKCQNICYNKLKTFTHIPIHYEAASRSHIHAYDVYSEMYTHPNRVLAIATHKAPKKYRGKPFYLCEYAHAMGVGAGSLDTYTDMFIKYDNLMGGCIWEWADHVAYKQHEKYELSYGGDHNEAKHDKNFCVDGLMSAFRKPHTGAYQMQACYRPMRVIANKGALLTFLNINRFISTDNYLVKYDILCDGIISDSGEFTLSIPPMGQTDKLIQNNAKNAVNVSIIISYYDKINDRFIAREEVKLSEGKTTTIVVGKTTKPIVKENEIELIIKNGDVTYTFSKTLAKLVGIKKRDFEYLAFIPLDKDAQGVGETIWKAPIDNEMYIRKRWEAHRYDKLDSKACSVTYDEATNTVTCIKKLVNKHKSYFNIKTCYVFGHESINVNSTLIPLKKLLPQLPKFGMILPLKSDFNTVSYFGLGEKENYPDFKAHSVNGIYTIAVTDFAEKHVMPQDSGNRSEVKWAKCFTNNGRSILIESVDKFININAGIYSPTNLTKALHREDLVDSGITYFNIDGYVKGCGSNSCGPNPLQEYILETNKNYSYSYRILIQ